MSPLAIGSVQDAADDAHIYGVDPDFFLTQHRTFCIASALFGGGRLGWALRRPVKRVRRQPFEPQWSVLILAVVLIGGSALAQERVFVTDGAGNTLLIMDTTSMPMITPIEVGQLPSGVAVRPDGAFAYVANIFSGNVSIINTALESEMGTVPPTPTMAGSDAVAVTPDGTQAYVTNRIANSVWVINLNTNQIDHTISIPSNPAGIAITPNGNFAFAAKSSLQAVAQINVQSDPPVFVRNIGVGDFPQGVAITPSGEFVYVCNLNGNSVSVIDLRAPTPFVSATIPVAGGPVAVAIVPNGTRAYVAKQFAGSVAVIDTTQATPVVIGTPIPVGMFPSGLASTLAGDRVYVANQTSQSLSIINTATHSVQTISMLGVNPKGITIASISGPPTPTPTPTPTAVPPTSTATASATATATVTA